MADRNEPQRRIDAERFVKSGQVLANRLFGSAASGRDLHRAVAVERVTQHLALDRGQVARDRVAVDASPTAEAVAQHRRRWSTCTSRTDLAPRLTAVADVSNLFGVSTPITLQGNPYLIGPPGYARNGVPTNDGVHQSVPWTYGTGGYVPQGLPARAHGMVRLAVPVLRSLTVHDVGDRGPTGKELA